MGCGEPLVSGVRGDQHDRSPFLVCRGAAVFASSAPPAFGRSAFESLQRGSARGAEPRSEADGMCRRASTVVKTQRNAEGLELPSRITSSARGVRFALKCCTNGISVRMLIRGRSGATPDVITVVARSVDEIRIGRLRPSGNSTTTKAGPRPDRSLNTASLLPNKQCCGSVIVTCVIVRSRIVGFSDVR